MKSMPDMLEEIVDKFIPMNPVSIRKKLLDYPINGLGEELGITEGRLWKKESDGAYRLVKQTRAGELPDFKLPANYGPIQTVIKDGYVLSKVGDPDRDMEVESGLGIEDCVAIPLGMDARYIISYSVTGDPSKHRAQKRFLRMVSGLAYRMLGEAERVQQVEVDKAQIQMQLELAYEIQKGTLPSRQPDFHDFDIHGVSIPLEREVGGDHYDYVRINENTLGFEVADAQGKGLTAAGHVSKVHFAIRMGLKHSSRIEELIQNVNSTMYDHFVESDEVGQFVTLFYAELKSNGALNYINAGHDQPLLLRDGKFQELDKGGLILGVDPNAQYERGVVSLRQDDVLTLITDGIAESYNRQDEKFGEDRLKQTIYDNQAASAKDIGRAILDAEKRFRDGYRIMDDKTVVVLKP